MRTERRRTCCLNINMPVNLLVISFILLYDSRRKKRYGKDLLSGRL